MSGLSPGAGNAQRTWPDRHALLLELHGSGARGHGEASPLPGYSDDDLEDAAVALAAIDADELARALEGVDVELALARASALVPDDVPSAQMALETAVLDWLGRARALSAPALLGAQHSSFALAWLAGPSGEEALRACRRARAAGYGTFKLKVGAPAALASELAFARTLRDELGSQAKLRLDANQAWAPAEAEAACSAFAACDVEFIEEPWIAASAKVRSPIALALDESLRSVKPAQIASYSRERGASVVVLKPMVLGGLSRCLALGRAAQAAGLGVVVSHTFDGPLALTAAAALALTLGGSLAHGLAPHAGLEAWPRTRLPLRDGSGYGWSEPGLGFATEPFA